MCWGARVLRRQLGAAVPAGCTMMLLPWQLRAARVVFPVASGWDPAAAGDVVSHPVGHMTGCSCSTRVHLHVCALGGHNAAYAGWPVVVPVFCPGLACMCVGTTRRCAQTCADCSAHGVLAANRDGGGADNTLVHTGCTRRD